ncbi:ribonuclease/clavin/mitogillin [Rossellomorea marisflavi]
MIFKQTSTKTERSGVQLFESTRAAFGVKLNCYAFYSDDVLIDTGSYSLRQPFRTFIDDVKPSMVLITHHHEDHTGNASYCHANGIPVLMSPLYAGKCSGKADYPMYRKLFWGKRPPFRSEQLPEVVQSGQGSMKVISTPGHAADHHSFLNEATGQLFSGDLYVSPKTKVVLREESIPEIIRSIERVLTYDFGEMFCCHAGYVKDGKKALKIKLEYLLKVKDKVMALHHEGLQIKEIQQALFPKTYPIMAFSRGEWDSKHIVSSIVNER